MAQKKKLTKTEEEKSYSEQLMDDIEPIWNMIDEGGPVHPTQYDESDDLEAAKRVEEKFVNEVLQDKKLAENLDRVSSEYGFRAVQAVDKLMVGIKEEDMDYSGAFESDVKEGSIKEKVLKGPDKKPKIRKSATAEEKLNFLGEWLAQEHLMIELAYDPLKAHHATRNNKLGPCDGKDPNGREVEIRTQKRNRTNFVIPKKAIKKCQTVERLVFIEYDDTNTINVWECHNRSVNEKNKTFALPIKHMQLLLSFDNADYAEQMRAVK